MKNLSLFSLALFALFSTTTFAADRSQTLTGKGDSYSSACSNAQDQAKRFKGTCGDNKEVDVTPVGSCFGHVEPLPEKGEMLHSVSHEVAWQCPEE